MANSLQSLRRLIAELRATLGWMDLVIGNVEESVCVIDANGRFVFLNQIFADIVGKPRIFLYGECLGDALDLRRGKQSLAELLDVPDKARAKVSANGLYEADTRAQGHRTFDVRVNYLPSVDQYVIILKDMTPELEQQNMQKSFISLASHQLRTPLTAIQIYANMLNDEYHGPLNEQQRDSALIIRDSAAHMNSLINSLLTISRVQTGQYQPQLEEFAPQELLDAVLKELGKPLKDKAITVRYTRPHSPLRMVSDRSLVHEILSNLVYNAVQYTPEGGTITLDYHATQTGVSFEVSDTGIGIPLADQANVFRQFYRSDNAIDMVPSGTGMGLFLIKHFVTMLGGSIRLESTEGEGTSFYVTLPRVHGEQKER